MYKHQWKQKETCIDVIVYHHIYKNGGTTIWDRYKNNPGAWLVPGSQHFELPQKGYHVVDGEMVQEDIRECTFMQCRIAPGVLERRVNKIDYVVTVRDPIDRLISGFNFWKKVNKIDLHFETWLHFSKSCHRDPPVFGWQYEWFVRHNLEHKDFNNAKQYDKDQQEKYFRIALEMVKSTYSEILFLSEPGYEQELARVMSDFKSEGTFITNTTIPSDVDTYTTRDDVDMGLIKDHLQWEIHFYKKLKHLFYKKSRKNDECLEKNQTHY